jgi:hypothetical protein
VAVVARNSFDDAPVLITPSRLPARSARKLAAVEPLDVATLIPLVAVTRNAVSIAKAQAAINSFVIRRCASVAARSISVDMVTTAAAFCGVSAAFVKLTRVTGFALASAITYDCAATEMAPTVIVPSGTRFIEARS